MAKSSLKIVLVDPLGDVLFSGDSLIGAALDEEATQTRAATVSGIYPRRRAADDVETETDEKDEDAQPAKDVARKGSPPLKWRVRAA